MGVWKRILWTTSAFAGSVGTVALLTEDKRTVFASWSTNSNPSVKWDDNWDKRHPKSLVKPPKNKEGKYATDDNQYNEELQRVVPKASRHIFLIRHGQYIVDGATDNDRYLTDLGREQAKLTGLRLKELGNVYDKIIASTMTRAAESAQILSACFPNVPLESCAMLREGAPIQPEPPVGHWRPEPSFFEDGARIEAAFRKYIHRAEPSQKEDSYEIIMCHANVIRYFVCRALQLPPEAWLRFSLHHCSITWLVIRPSGRVAIKLFGDSGHFPKDKMSLSGY